MDEIKERSLEETPVWAVSLVCFALILLSMLIEAALHLLTKVHVRSFSFLHVAIVSPHLYMIFWFSVSQEKKKKLTKASLGEDQNR